MPIDRVGLPLLGESSAFSATSRAYYGSGRAGPCQQRREGSDGVIPSGVTPSRARQAVTSSR
jgi:hypothetical protein